MTLCPHYMYMSSKSLMKQQDKAATGATQQAQGTSTNPQLAEGTCY